jgi:hypothetical protein
MLIGLLGNGSAVCYFWPRRNKTIYDLLYLTITAVDFLTISLSIAIAATLLNDRYPLLFKNDIFCTVWSSGIIFTAKMSMFLAMLICTTRTIAMKCPQHVIKRKYLIGAIASYASYIISIYLIFLPQKWHASYYSGEMSSCTVDLGSKMKPALYFGITTYIIELSLPSITTVICFFVSVWVLKTPPALGNENDKKFRQVSVTITIFTAVFLVCNAPCFLFFIWWHGEGILPTPSEVFPFKGIYYVQLMLQIFPLFLNAVINPILYLLRMPGYQTWTRQSLKSSRSKSQKVCKTPKTSPQDMPSLQDVGHHISSITKDVEASEVNSPDTKSKLSELVKEATL